MFLDIPDPLDREAVFSPCEELSEASPRVARGSARPRIISFPLDDLIDFLENILKGLKRRPRGLGRKTHNLKR